MLPAGANTSRPLQAARGRVAYPLKAAQRREARRAVELFGLPREVEPHEALLGEVQSPTGAHTGAQRVRKRRNPLQTAGFFSTATGIRSADGARRRAKNPALERNVAAMNRYRGP
jgi:hypothetical protein